MFLGTAESVAGSEEMFTPERNAQHFFHKRVLRGDQQVSFYPQDSSGARLAKHQVPTSASKSTDRLLFEALAKSLGQNSLLVTEDYTIARIFGDVSPFVQMNDASSLKMHLDLLRSPLREEARSLITIALKNRAHRAGVKHLLGADDQEEVRIDVYPIVAPDINEQAALVTFTRVKVDQARKIDVQIEALGDGEISKRIVDLEQEVATTREALQQTIEELETSNEELQSLNEELQSTNEELQATNEELETSNEELQSTNEELITVNEELHVTASELSGRTGELTSVLESAPLSILVMDSALQLTQLTNSAAQLFDIKRPLNNPHVSQCRLPDGYPSLAPLCNEALKLGQTTSHEFNSLGAKISMTCAPYFSEHGKILGVTVAIIEFPGLAQEMEYLLNHTDYRVINRDHNGTILRISKASADSLNLTREEAMGKNIFDLVSDEYGEQLKAKDAELLQTGGSSQSLSHITTKDGKDIYVDMEEFAYLNPTIAAPSVFSVGKDVTDVILEHRRVENLLKQIELLTDMAKVGYWTFNVDKSKLFWSEEVFRIHGVKAGEYIPSIDTALAFYHPDDQDFVSAAGEKAASEDREFRFKKRIVRPDGEVVLVESHGITIHDEQGGMTDIVGVFREVAE
jgi:two-component system CheB/CheR fusion protein